MTGRMKKFRESLGLAIVLIVFTSLNQGHTQELQCFVNGNDI